MTLYHLGVSRWSEGAEAMGDLKTAATALSKWMDAAGEVVNTAADAEAQAEAMGHPLHGEGFWVPADHWRPLARALAELR